MGLETIKKYTKIRIQSQSIFDQNWNQVVHFQDRSTF